MFFFNNLAELTHLQ